MTKVNTAAKPKLAMCNIFSDVAQLKAYALEHAFAGIDWSFDVRTLPDTPAEEAAWIKDMSELHPLEVRYHCPFFRIDLGHADPWEAKAAEVIFQRIIRLVASTEGKYLTIHIGLGRDSTEPLSWEKTVNNLARVVQHGISQGVRVCLENLVWGWTSRPQLFEKLIRKSGVGVTFDIGHADACESIQSHDYTLEDFVTPHSDRIYNAHIYHTEVAGLGHVPPERLEDIQGRLDLLRHIGCLWWVLEVREARGLLQTKQILDRYFTQVDDQAAPDGQSTSGRLPSRNVG